MNKRNIDVIYDEAMHCGIFNLVWLPVMAGICFFQKRRYPVIIMFFIQIVLLLKMISKIFVNYRPDRKCPLCEAVIPEDSNYCPSCGYIVHKDLCGMEDTVEFNEAEAWDVGKCDINAVYRQIEEEVIDGIA